MNSLLRALLICVLTVQFAGCGGSGPAEMSPPPPQQTNPSQPTAQDLANAKAADLTGILDLSSNTMTLSWVDNFKSATGYNIEQQSSSGAWSLVETIPGQGGAGQRLSWMRTVTSQAAFRVTAQLSGYTVTLLAAGQQDFVQISPPATVPGIVLDQPQPITESVAVSLQNAGKAQVVDYFIDSTNFADNGVAPDFRVILDTSTLTSTSHSLLARLQTGVGAFLEVQRNVTVARGDLRLTIKVDGTTGMVNIFVLATSNVGVQSASASLDGVSLGTQTVATPTTDGPAFEFTVDALKAGSGQHVISATALDLNGNEAGTSVYATFSNPPTLTLDSPVDGGLVNGTMTLSGTFGSDKPGPVNLVVSLGNSTVLQTSTSPFNATVNLATIPNLQPGNATLTLVATDSTGTSMRLTSGVTITSSPALVFTPLATLGSKGSLLTVSASAVLYQTADQRVHLHSDSTDTVLDTTALLDAEQWTMSGTDVVAIGTLMNDGQHLLHWTGDGVRHDAGLAPGTQIRGIRLPWVLGAVSQGAVFVNLTTGTQVVPSLVMPTFPLQTADFGASFRAIAPVTPDFYLSANGLVLLYLSGQIGIDRWDQSTGQSQPVSADGSEFVSQPNVETDGSRAAWFTHAPGNSSTPVLMSFDISSNSTQTVSTSPEQFQLADGILAWTEILLNTNNVALKTSDGSTISTAATGVQALFGSAGGRVLYESNDTLSAWSPQHGAQLLLEVPPGKAMIGGGTAYFTNGSQQTLYAVPLN